MITNREIQQILELKKQVQKFWETHGAEILRRVRIAEEAYSRVWNQLGDQLLQSIEDFQQYIAPHLELVRQAIDALPPRIKRIMIHFAESGWFVSPWLEFAHLTELQEIADRDDADSIDEVMASYFRAELDAIEDSLITQFSSRAPILKSAFTLHREARYEASIPLFLIQADGICHEILGVQLFRQSQGIPATADAIDTHSIDPLAAAIMEPLRVLLPISYHTSRIDLTTSMLNRHAILHGLTTAYPSEVNSLKAASLLYYVSTIRVHRNVKNAAAN